MPYWNLTWILTYGIVLEREGISTNVTNKGFVLFFETVLFQNNAHIIVGIVNR